MTGEEEIILVITDKEAYTPYCVDAPEEKLLDSIFAEIATAKSTRPCG